MDLDSTRNTPVSPKCFRCKLPGHFSNNCPSCHDVRMMTTELEEVIQQRLFWLDTPNQSSCSTPRLSLRLARVSTGQRVNCTPPLSSHNRFSTLSVDNIPKIDEPVASSQVVQPLERPPEGVPIQRCVWRPRWEQCLLAQFIVDVLDETEGPRRSLRLNIELQTTDTRETRAVKALLDSRATGMFIAYVKANRLPT